MSSFSLPWNLAFLHILLETFELGISTFNFAQGFLQFYLMGLLPLKSLAYSAELKY